MELLDGGQILVRHPTKFLRLRPIIFNDFWLNFKELNRKQKPPFQIYCFTPITMCLIYASYNLLSLESKTRQLSEVVQPSSVSELAANTSSKRTISLIHTTQTYGVLWGRYCFFQTTCKRFLQITRWLRNVLTMPTQRDGIGSTVRIC
jgi:hypothetical protein